MASIVQRLYDRHQLPALPKFVGASVQYEVLMGSVAYGIAEERSDFDVYAICIPPRDYVFPHLRGEIPGFSPPGPRFEHFEQHRVLDPSAQGGEGRRYDLTVYSIVKFFRLCADANPNLIDTLFVPRRCVLYSTPLGERVREQRTCFCTRAPGTSSRATPMPRCTRCAPKSPRAAAAPWSKRMATISSSPPTWCGC
jgi:predicted nucleotidyltransferase